MNDRLKKRILLLVCIMLCTLPLLTLRTHAEENTYSTEILPDEYLDFLDSLPDTLTELLPDSLFSTSPEEVSAAVMELSDFSYLLRTLLSLIGLRLGDCVRMLAVVLGVLLLVTLLRTWNQAHGAAGIVKAFALLCDLFVILVLVGESYAGMESVSAYLTALSGFTSASVPLLGALYAMGGNIGAAAASASGLSLFLTLLEGVIGSTVIPICAVCLAFSLVSSLEPSLRLGGLVGTLKRQYSTVLGFLMMLLLAMLGAQTTLGARSDTLAMKSVKFATGNLIPVVGGSVSELLRTVGAGVSYLRGGVGICGILLLILLLLPTLVELLLLRMTWQLLGGIAELLGCDGEKRLLDEFASIHGFLIAAVAICSAIPILSFTLLMHCASAVG